MSRAAAALLALALAGAVRADEAWNGEWIAEGTLFRVAVSVRDEVMTVTQLESLGFAWRGPVGTVRGGVAEVVVEYAGASGVVRVELVDARTAVAYVAACTPDYMVVCVLARDRQAVFRKVAERPPGR